MLIITKLLKDFTNTAKMAVLTYWPDNLFKRIALYSQKWLFTCFNPQFIPYAYCFIKKWWLYGNRLSGKMYVLRWDQIYLCTAKLHKRNAVIIGIHVIGNFRNTDFTWIQVCWMSNTQIHCVYQCEAAWFGRDLEKCSQSFDSVTLSI